MCVCVCVCVRRSQWASVGGAHLAHTDLHNRFTNDSADLTGELNAIIPPAFSISPWNETIRECESTMPVEGDRSAAVHRTCEAKRCVCWMQKIGGEVSWWAGERVKAKLLGGPTGG